MSNINLINSLWRETAVTTPKNFKQLNENTNADVTIIGAGFTGLRAALELSEQDFKVVVLDSYEPGWGASGRNGGQVNPMAHESPEEIIQHLGTTFGPRMIQSYTNSANELFALIKKYNLQCDAVQNGWLKSGHTRPSILQIQNMAESWSKEGLDLSIIEGEELHKLVGSSHYNLASKVTSGGSVQPLSYVRELARVAIEKGTKIYKNSQAIKLNQLKDSWNVETERGSVTSNWVLFCTNAYSDNTLTGLKQSISPVVSVQAATRPLTKDEYEQILPNHNTLSDNRRVVYYTRKDNHNRLVFGCAGLEQDCKGSDRKRLQQGLNKVFPQFTAKDIEFYWGGRFAISPDSLPHLHEPEKGILAGLGYNGRGVAMATLMGRVLAERVAGKDQQNLDIPITPYGSFRLRPFHKLGLPIAVKYYECIDTLEEKLSK